MEAVTKLTVKEAATRLRLSGASVYALCAAKKLRHVRVGVGRGKLLIPLDAIEEYLAKGEIGTADATAPPPLPPIRPQVRPRPLHVRMKP